jgi:hypothetical protein
MRQERRFQGFSRIKRIFKDDVLACDQAHLLHRKPLKNKQNPFHLSKSLKSFSLRIRQSLTDDG